jgi:hypothetical protein
MWLTVFAVFVPPNCGEDRLVQGLSHRGKWVGDGERIAVEEEDQIVGTCLGHDLGCQEVELSSVPTDRRYDPVEFGGVVTGDVLKIGHHPVRFVDVAGQVFQLDVDPLCRLVMDGGDVDHGEQCRS